jgi:phospholipid/cholesterol/gamma-HCH transport system permease protein
MAMAAGAIMVVQAGMYVRMMGAYNLLGWGAGFATLREVGPVFIALIFSGRVGAQTTAELATMVVTDQVDALRLMAIDPLRLLVGPRVVALTVVLVCLTMIGDVMSILGGAVTAKLLLDVGPTTFFDSLRTYGTTGDVLNGLCKSVAFAVAIAGTACHHGMSVRGGAASVGRAVNASVVASAAWVFLVDFALAFLLQGL